MIISCGKHHHDSPLGAVLCQVNERRFWTIIESKEHEWLLLQTPIAVVDRAGLHLSDMQKAMAAVVPEGVRMITIARELLGRRKVRP